jgi:hypothetical protein
MADYPNFDEYVKLIERHLYLENMEIFDLRKQVEEFVFQEMKRLRGTKRWFQFYGLDDTNNCRVSEAHPPHVMATCKGEGRPRDAVFCLGKPGDRFLEGTVVIVIEKSSKSFVQGYWILQ